VLALYLSYLKAAVVVMVWATGTFATYGLLRTSTVAEVVAAASVSLVLSLVVALMVADLLSPSRPVRRALTVAVAPVMAWLHRPRAGAGRHPKI
jgi:hypothetical protein